MKELLDKEGKIDILINNAGTIQERKPITELSLENWQTMINVHLTGAFIYCKNVLPHMIKKNNGHIINVTSRFGLYENAKAEFGSLNVVKAGLNMLTKVVAKELENTDVRVNSVLPAPTLTDFLNTVFDEDELDNMREKGILGETSEFVELVNSVVKDDDINDQFVLASRFLDKKSMT